MHDTQQDPVDVGQMIAWIADGETPDGQQKIGTEPVSYTHLTLPTK